MARGPTKKVSSADAGGTARERRIIAPSRAGRCLAIEKPLIFIEELLDGNGAASPE
jgi:hypothetical protein